MPTTTRPPLKQRKRASARTFLVWSGFVLAPLALNGLLVTAVTNQNNFSVQVAFLLPLMAVVLLLAALRRGPLVATALMFVNIATLELGQPSPWPVGFHSALRIVEMLAVDIAVGYVAATRRPRVSTVTAVVVLVAQSVVAAAFNVNGMIGGNDVANEITQDALVLIVAWVIGNAVRQRRRATETQRTQAEAQAVQAERLRIARELHDMVAHSVGVIAIQAGMGRRVIDTQPGEARDALAAIEDTSRDTLAALRRMVGTLRRADPGPEPAPLAPAAGLADLDGLVARSSDAGVRVEVHWRGDRQPLPPDVDLAAFRIIQEAVTNVIRHAGAQHCEVLVDQRDDELAIEILDDGRGAETSLPRAFGPGKSTASPERLRGTGYGIPGMRERVGLLSGEFSAGPRPDGGFRVAARVPCVR